MVSYSVNLRTNKPMWEFTRYILVDGFNTVFGYGLFALLNWSFTGMGTFSYTYAAVLANFIAISVAFLGYEWFVFRTRGNYFREWLRCFGVYGISALIGLGGLSILVAYSSLPLAQSWARALPGGGNDDGGYRGR